MFKEERVAASDERVLEEPRNRPRAKKGRLPKGEVHIFDNWCKGCGLCIEFCPAGVLVLGTDSRPKPVYPEKCIACHWCELHCPDFAIFVTDIEPEQPIVSSGQTEQVLEGGV